MKTNKATAPKPTIGEVSSLSDLRARAAKDPRYEKLAIAGARNLGADGGVNFSGAMRWLEMNAAETSEDGVVGEVNFCRDLVV